MQAGRDMRCPGDDARGPALAYRVSRRDGAPGFVVPTTGRLLCATPDGSVTADRDAQGGWETFALEPALSAQHGPLPPGLDGDVAATGAHARDQACRISLLTALLRLLDEADARRLAAELRDLPIYQAIFPALRRHLSPHRDGFEWLTRRHLQGGMLAHGWSIGAHTYGAPEITDGEHGRLSIGSYCSIAGQVQIVLANHTTVSVTSYPFALLAAFWPSAAPNQADHVGRDVVIGSDVWIGAGACILPGARIGDGAVIGARCVVARPVPPYAVVVGNPARVVRRCFEDAQVEALLALRWWSWPEHVVDRFVPLLLQGSVDAFIAAAAEAGLAAAPG